MHILCLVLFWSFSVFFYDSGVAPPSPFPPSPFWQESPCHARTYRHTAIFFLYKQRCCRHSLVCEILVFWSAGFCTVSAICVVVYWGTCTLPTIKFEGRKLAMGWHGLHFLILKVVRQVVLGISLIYVPQAWSFCWGILFVERVCLFFSPVYFLCQPSGIHCALRPRSLVFCFPLICWSL